jgi:hypothetical protein
MGKEIQKERKALIAEVESLKRSAAAAAAESEAALAAAESAKVAARR